MQMPVAIYLGSKPLKRLLASKKGEGPKVRGKRIAGDDSGMEGLWQMIKYHCQQGHSPGLVCTDPESDLGTEAGVAGTRAGVESVSLSSSSMAEGQGLGKEKEQKNDRDTSKVGDATAKESKEAGADDGAAASRVTKTTLRKIADAVKTARQCKLSLCSLRRHSAQ